MEEAPKDTGKDAVGGADKKAAAGKTAEQPVVNDWVAANEKRKKQKKPAGVVNENLDMDELLKKKEDRNW